MKQVTDWRGQRVLEIGCSDGRLTRRLARLGALAQRNLLEAEGVEFDAKDRVDLKRFGWREEDDSDEPEQPSLL